MKSVLFLTAIFISYYIVWCKLPAESSFKERLCRNGKNNYCNYALKRAQHCILSNIIDQSSLSHPALREGRDGRGTEGEGKSAPVRRSPHRSVLCIQHLYLLRRQSPIVNADFVDGAVEKISIISFSYIIVWADSMV